MRIFTVLFICGMLQLLSTSARAYNSLTVSDPRWSWSSYEGTIEEATLSMKPKGAYMEYGLYLTFSARGTYYSRSTDTLEVVYNFDLPKEAIVHDSWLWVENDIVKADILDRWTASNIYEGIVKRRKDPSILTKKNQTQYELRIFPLVGNQTRKVKITYLMPMNWGSNEVSAPIQLNNLKFYKNQLSKINILLNKSEFTEPKFKETPSVAFVPVADTVPYLKAMVDISNLSSLNLSFKSPILNGVYLKKFSKDADQEGYYQLAINPAKALNIQSQKKVAILLDYDLNKSTTTKSEILQRTKSFLLSNFSEKDSFNLIFSNMEILRASQKWIPGDSLSIENAFASVGSTPLGDYSNLPSLLFNGINFIKSNGNNGLFLLASNSENFKSSESANALLNDLKSKMDPLIPFHIVDFITNPGGTYINGTYYYGNEYFYINLSKITKGNYYYLRNTNLSFLTLLEKANQTLSGTINSFDLYTTLENGFCYGRYSIGASNTSVSIGATLLQLGKYNGSFPFIAQATGVFDGKTFSKKVFITADNLVEGDSLSKVVWTGNNIQLLESHTQTNSIINEIITKSIEDRVLSLHTAFLALEPSETVKVCETCEDETKLVTSLDKIIKDSLDVTVFPNPVVTNATIKISIPENFNIKSTSVAIFNNFGILVKEFELDEASFVKRKLDFIWEGEDNSGNSLPNGMYHLIVSSSHGQRKIVNIILSK